MNTLQTFFSNITAGSHRFCLFVSAVAVVLMIGFTSLQEFMFSKRPLQIKELAGREVSTDKMVEVFLRMDELALRQHYLLVWTVNGVIFLSSLLVLRTLGGAISKK